MKVCQIMAGDEEGGLENHFVELCNGLNDKVDEVVVIAHEKYRERFVSGVKFIALDLSRGRRNPILLARLAMILRRESPDIVHAQANKAVDMVSRIKCMIPGILIGSLHSLKRKLSGFRKMDRVIGVSQGVLAGLQHAHKHVIYNGMTKYEGTVCTRQQLIDRFSLDADRPVCIAVGRLVKVKAYDNLIDAWQGLDAQLLLIGDGPERDFLSRKIAQHQLESRVILAGFCSDVRGLMSAADLMVFSSHKEGFSYALAEALLCRLPVVSTRVPGAAEILPESYLVPVDDVAALHAKLEESLDNLAKTREDQTSLFDWAEKTLSLENMVAETYQTYVAALSRPVDIR